MMMSYTAAASGSASGVRKVKLAKYIQKNATQQNTSASGASAK